MELPKGWKGSQEAIVLAGIILGCALQLGGAQQRVSVILESSNLQEGQDATFSVREAPRQFEQCEWYLHSQRGERNWIAGYVPNPDSQERNITTRSSRETVRSDCSLHITDLRQSDTGNYSVVFSNQSPDKSPDQPPERVYEGSVYLQVSALEQIPIHVRLAPQQPRAGQDVTLTPQGTTHGLELCEWFKQESSGIPLPVAHYRPRDHQSGKADSRERLTVGQDCSLRITKLTTADSGTYIVEIQVLLDRKPHQPGQGSSPQGPGGIREYVGQVELKVNQASHQEKYNHAAGLSYSAGVIAGALLGFFAWTDTFTSLFCLLCSSSARPGRLL